MASNPYVALLRHVAPHVSAAMTPIIAQLENVMSKVHRHCEIEARLGRLIRNIKGRQPTFAPGVDEGYVSWLLCRLETCDFWTCKTPWTESIDRYYLLPSGLQVRTTSHVVGEEASYETSHMIKTDVSKVDLHWQDSLPRTMMTSADGSIYDVRISVKNEEPVYEDELQERVDEMHLVRIKQRKSFLYTPAGSDRPVWSIDVTLVWEGPTYLDVLQSLRDGVKPRYEVELECHNARDYIESQGSDFAKVALSFLLKIADLFEASPTVPLVSTPARLVH